MKNNELLTLILDEMQTMRALQSAQYKTQLNTTYALDVNSAYPAEMLKAQYGPKPEPVTTCEQSLYSHVEGHGNLVHHCKRPNKHAGAHITSMYGTEIKWDAA